MKDNLAFVRTKSGGLAFAVVIEKSVLKKVERFLIQDQGKLGDDPIRCVIPEYDSAQSQPIIKIRVSMGYNTFLGAAVSVFTGWHFIRKNSRPIYRANSEGLRLITEYGSPEKAYASLS